MMVDDNSNMLVKLVSDHNKYNGQAKEEGLTFLEMVHKKKARERKAAEDEKKEMEKREERIRRNRERKRLMILRLALLIPPEERRMRGRSGRGARGHRVRRCRRGGERRGVAVGAGRIGRPRDVAL